jgi:hypothetical protein
MWTIAAASASHSIRLSASERDLLGVDAFGQLSVACDKPVTEPVSLALQKVNVERDDRNDAVRSSGCGVDARMRGGWSR